MARSGLTEIDDARRIVLDAVKPLSDEAIELDAALGRVLSEEVSASESVPSFDNSAMDGYAIRAADLTAARPEHSVRLRLVGESRAGSPAQATLGDGQAIAISTGAMIPTGADAILKIEDARPVGDHVEIFGPVLSGEYIRRAGEDVRAGAPVLGPGTMLGAVELGVLASLGYVRVRCARRPRVSVLLTGDELLAPGEPLRPGAVRDSGSLTISALARGGGAVLVRSDLVGDEAEATRTSIASAVEDVDVAVICGGVSVGAHDHVRGSLEALGAHERFWGIALKPGRPAWFGTLGSTLVFALPGNPVSAMVTFILLVGPALRALQGLPGEAPRLTAVLDDAYEKPFGRAHALRCRLIAREDGWHAQSTGAQGSHILTSMLGADALAIIPSETLIVRAGERVEIEPLRIGV